MWLKKIIFGILLLSLAFGGWGVFILVTNGQEVLGLNSFVVWGLWMSLYVLFASMAAGMFAMSTFDLLFKLKTFAGTGKVFLLASFASLCAGLAHILVNEGRPERVINVFIYPNWDSVLTWSVWIYTAIAIATAVLLLVLFIPERKIPVNKDKLVKGLMIIGFPIAVLAAGAVGFTLSTQASQAFWNEAFFPILFPIFGLSAGFGLARILVAVFGDKKSHGYDHATRIMAISTIILLFANLYIIGSLLFVSDYGGNPAAVAAVEYILFGPYWYGFWIFQIGLGVLIPLVILARIVLNHNLKHKWLWAASAGTMVIVGTAVARLNFIIPAQAVAREDFLSSPYSGVRFAGEYIPTMPEWAVSVGITALFIVLFYATAKKMKLLPIVFKNGGTK